MSEIKEPFSKKRRPLQELLPLEQPLRIEIDPSSICNFKCDFCFQSIASDFKGQIMSKELFEKILIQLKEFKDPISKIYLYALGEPLLNKNLPYFVKRLKEEGVASNVAITTNGSLLSRNLARQLVMAGLDQISISLNGLCDNDFKRICKANVDFEEMYDAIKYFYENKGTCYVHIKIEGKLYPR